ncbi:APH(3') family aminoglycoside O-phosphotransferase [Alkalicoccobacillus porphyridii]|uniref:Aminoglycoside 3'-phosphotransferase n=1 Tax=Alkalicoccobacillus porphyridii TaxID=2597270 RepID=A0A554A1N3_9BACI|nr:APH(3') family aminoglycoside O-phosphotransferase [Alkalicoccobacillus porphyridii]TSB47602.1 aminoglycoside 3'-phosphotransferase [Alkalicoccobacillus porphyridii]
MNLPISIEELIQGYSWEQNTIGLSSSNVYQLRGERTLFLKTQDRKHPFESLYDEKQKLEWLADKLPVPNVLFYEQAGQTEYLLMTALPGLDASRITEPTQLPTIIQAYADGLKQLHQIDIWDCPFNEQNHIKVKKAEEHVKAGIVDEDDFDQIRLGKSSEELLEELKMFPPFEEDLVFTHGDYCLPNIIIKDGACQGFIDLGRAGIADRYQDIALAVRSITHNFGSEWVSTFVTHYGLTEFEQNKVFYYQLLDEFF